MQLVETIAACRTARAALTGTVGLVPTMGYLHAGHMSLVQAARQACDHVVVSIFVNPTQFRPDEDLATYPRDMQRDLAMLRQAEVDVVFAPTADELYPPGYDTYVTVGNLAAPLEGAARPGFFRGVATIVTKLLNIVAPQQVFFGQKDAQQSLVVQKFVAELNIPTRVVVCPTIREDDGLALSSRNQYLTPAERAAAPVLYRALTAARVAYERGERSADRLRAIMRVTLGEEPHAHTEYVSVADPRTLREADTVGDDGALLSLAVQMGRARLIDNIVLPPPSNRNRETNQ